MYVLTTLETFFLSMYFKLFLPLARLNGLKVIETVSRPEDFPQLITKAALQIISSSFAKLSKAAAFLTHFWSYTRFTVSRRSPGQLFNIMIFLRDPLHFQNFQKWKLTQQCLAVVFYPSKTLIDFFSIFQ